MLVIALASKGLMVGIEMKEPVAPVVAKMLESHVICGSAGPNVLRLLPPLIITGDHVDRAVATLDTVLGEK